MERSLAHSPQEENGEETDNDLRKEVLKDPEQVLSTITCKQLFASSIAEKIKTLPKLIMDDYELNLETSMTEYFIEKARKELRETPEVTEEALAVIREMVKEDPDLNIPNHNEFFVRFLRPCKWYPKSAFRLIQRCYRFRVNYSNICKNLTPMALKNTFCADVLIPLPKRCINGCRILVIHSGYKWKPKEVSLEDIMRTAMTILEAALSEPQTQVAGVQVIIDMEGLSLSQVTYFTPRFAAAVAEWVQKCLPCRLKSIHIVNQPFIFNMVFAIFKPFLSEKLRKRIHFHGTNKQNILAAIGAEALPKKYGGELNLLDNPLGDKIWKYFCYFQEEFEETLKFGYLSKE